MGRASKKIRLGAIVQREKRPVSARDIAKAAGVLPDLQDARIDRASDVPGPGSARGPNTRKGARHPQPAQPEEVRSVAVRALIAPGKARIEAVERLAALDAGVRPLVIAAAEAGVPYRRITELTGVPRTTVGRWISESTVDSPKGSHQ